MTNVIWKMENWNINEKICLRKPPWARNTVLIAMEFYLHSLQIEMSFAGSAARRLRQSENDHCRRPRRRPPKTRSAARSGRDVLSAVDRVCDHSAVHRSAGVESVKNLARAGVERQKISGHLPCED